MCYKYVIGYKTVDYSQSHTYTALMNYRDSMPKNLFFASLKNDECTLNITPSLSPCTPPLAPLADNPR